MATGLSLMDVVDEMQICGEKRSTTKETLRIRKQYPSDLCLLMMFAEHLTFHLLDLCAGVLPGGV